MRITTISLTLLFCITIGCKSNLEETKEVGSKSVTIFNGYGTLNPNAPKETEQWGQLAGEWDCISKDLDMRDKENPKWHTNKATWKWEYVMGGHAVLNQWWQEDTSSNPPTKEYYATGIFIFNPKTKLWEINVMNSRPHKISPKFQASYNDGKIVMHDGSGNWQVTFFDFKKDSFEWKYDIKDEGGEWVPISLISAKRKNKT